MRTFVYFHYGPETQPGNAPLLGVYLFDGEFTFFEFPELKFTLSTLIDGCTHEDADYEPENYDHIFDYFEVFQDVHTNDMKNTQRLLRKRRLSTAATKVRYSPLIPNIEVMYDLAAGLLRRQLKEWLEIQGNYPTETSKRVLADLATIAGILNRARA